MVEFVRCDACHGDHRIEDCPIINEEEEYYIKKSLKKKSREKKVEDRLLELDDDDLFPDEDWPYWDKPYV